MIQAMTWALVPTSGAGMSRSVPTMPSISVAKRRVSASSSRVAERAGVTRDAALGAAEGHVDEGALPGHPHGQGAHVIEVRPRVEAKAALGRPARRAVLDAVAGEDLDAAVITPHREVHGPLALAHREEAAHALLEGKVIGRGAELGERRVERARTPGLRDKDHRGDLDARPGVRAGRAGEMVMGVTSDCGSMTHNLTALREGSARRP